MLTRPRGSQTDPRRGVRPRGHRPSPGGCAPSPRLCCAGGRCIFDALTPPPTLTLLHGSPPTHTLVSTAFEARGQPGAATGVRTPMPCAPGPRAHCAHPGPLRGSTMEPVAVLSPPGVQTPPLCWRLLRRPRGAPPLELPPLPLRSRRSTYHGVFSCIPAHLSSAKITRKCLKAGDGPGSSQHAVTTTARWRGDSPSRRLPGVDSPACRVQGRQGPGGSQRACPAEVRPRGGKRGAGRGQTGLPLS